jgi:hypothetical protein
MLRPATLLLILAGLTFAAPRKDAGKVPAYYPPERTTLVYKVSDGELTEVVTKVKETDGGIMVYYDRQTLGAEKSQQVFLSNSDGLFLVEEDGEKYEPRWCALKFGAKPGDSWTVETSRSDIGKVSAKLTLGKTEQVNVAGGMFDTVRVDMAFTASGVEAKLSYWYAEGIGVVKIQDGEKIARELKSVTTNPKK